MATKQFTTEFSIKCAPSVLYKFLSTPAGLQEWFADKVNEWNQVFTFEWNDGDVEKAKLIEEVADKYVRFSWLERPSTTEFLEFKIDQTEVSNLTILTITDAADEAEIENRRQLWSYQVKELFHKLGA